MFQHGIKDSPEDYVSDDRDNGEQNKEENVEAEQCY